MICKVTAGAILCAIFAAAGLIALTRADLLGAWGFAKQDKLEISAGVFIYKTSGQDAMIGDVDGIGLIDGNVKKYSIVNGNVYVAYICGKDGRLRYCVLGKNKRLTPLSEAQITNINWRTP